MKSTVASNDESNPTGHTYQTHCQNLTGKKFFYPMNRSSPVKELIDDYSDYYSMEPKSIMFVFGGRLLNPYPEKIPNELHMKKDGDIIESRFRLGLHIKLKIKTQDGYEASFGMHPCSQLEKLMGFYCRRRFLDITGLAFLFNGRLIQAEETPSELVM